jgi:hypothetical protein
MNHRVLSRMVRTTVMGLVLAATMSAGAQMVNESRPYSGTTTNPCNGESVSFSGTIHFLEKTQIATDGRIHYIANNNFNASGVGQSTGVTYNIGGMMNTNSKFPGYPIAFNQRSRFISTGSAPSFFATFAFHVNGNGVQTHVTTTSDCKG